MHMSENQQLTAGQGVVAYLGHSEFEDGEAIRGAILVADEWGKPLEFRCTAPVRPTSMQRTLYGKSLLPHVLTELIGKPLLASLREKPVVVLITDPAYFDVREKITTPVLRLAKANGEQEKTEGAGKSKFVTITSAAGKFPALEIEPHWKYGNDVEVTGERLRDLFGRWDLHEPFQRLVQGLKYVHDEGVLES
jgi:hypothetical protein